MMRKTFGPMMIAAMLAGCGGGLAPFQDSSGYDSFILSGWAAYNDSRFEEAQSQFSQAITADPVRSDGYIGDGWSLLMRQKPDSALVAFFKGFGDVHTGKDSLDIICGVSGCYLAKGENTQVISYLGRFDLDRLSKNFPLAEHDFFIDRGDIELACSLAFYRLKIYSSKEGPDPNNAVYHLNKALPAPMTYTTPQDLMERMTEFYNQSEGIPVL
jgi:hypothetical protein